MPADWEEVETPDDLAELDRLATIRNERRPSCTGDPLYTRSEHNLDIAIAFIFGTACGALAAFIVIGINAL